MTLFKLSTRPVLEPAKRVAMPIQAASPSSPLRPRMALVPINVAGAPPHYHIVDRMPARVVAPEVGMQAMRTVRPKGLLSCEDAGCLWFLNGREGIDDGAPFTHPAGVECGDFARCEDKNCPCPQNVIEWPTGECRGHAIPCVYCSGVFSHVVTGAIREVSFDEYFYRLDEGLDSLVTIKSRGL